MSRLSFINRASCFLLVFFFLLANIAFSENGVRGNDIFFSDKGPIEITSQKLQTYNNSNKAIFEGNVIAKQGQTTLYAQWMQVKYNDDGQVEEIHARGDVKVVKLDRVITSDEVVYFSKEGKIVFTGSPVARDKKSTVTGSKMVYYIKDGRSIVENSRVVLKGKKTKKEDK
ncbi:MAG: LPS export ABC transporter periplasmic protein LptC [Nitrospirae bacterium]|nr:LPS export ABC transporter periplasmic protein LptC [Nitrospirota bacterium]